MWSFHAAYAGFGKLNSFGALLCFLVGPTLWLSYGLPRNVYGTVGIKFFQEIEYSRIHIAVALCFVEIVLLASKSLQLPLWLGYPRHPTSATKWRIVLMYWQALTGNRWNQFQSYRKRRWDDSSLTLSIGWFIGSFPILVLMLLAFDNAYLSTFCGPKYKPWKFSGSPLRTVNVKAQN